MISIPELPRQKRQVNILCLFSHSSFSPFVSLRFWNRSHCMVTFKKLSDSFQCECYHIRAITCFCRVNELLTASRELAKKIKKKDERLPTLKLGDSTERYVIIQQWTVLISTGEYEVVYTVGKKITPRMRSR